MQNENSSTRNAHLRMSLRLRHALGLVGVGVVSLGSGPCGPCIADAYTTCHTLRALEAARAQYIETGCHDGVAGQAGASQGSSGSEHAAGAAGSSICDQWSYQRVRAWDPATGCPEWSVVSDLDYAHRRATGNGLPQAKQDDTEPTCCQDYPAHCPGGRPFVVEGRARLPALVVEPLAAETSALSAALAQSWAEDGLAEYASIASFARLTLQLMAFGAPAELIEASQQASLDEHRHAQLCFAEAARHAGRRAEPGPLDMGRACDTPDFESFMFLNLVEGCVGETLAALRVAEQARRAESPALARTLTEISEDEARHAELAFAILRFGLTLDRRSTLAALRRVLELRFDDEVADGQDLADASWEAHGRLSMKTRRQVDEDGWTQVLAPLFQALLPDESCRAVESQRDSARA